MIIGSKRAQDKERNGWLKGFFKGKDVFIIGGGKSAEELPQKTLTKLKKATTIVMGAKIKLIPEPTMFVMLDPDLPDRLGMPGDWPFGQSFKVLAGPQSKLPADGNVFRFGQVHGFISRSPESLLADVSGLAALNAAHMGNASRIFLVGIDCGFGLWNKSRGAPTMKDADFKLMRRYQNTVPLFEKFRKFENVYTTDKKTNLEKFPFMDLEVALAGGTI